VIEAEFAEKYLKESMEHLKQIYYDFAKEHGINLDLSKYLAKRQPLHSLAYSKYDPLPKVRESLLEEKKHEAYMRNQNYYKL